MKVLIHALEKHKIVEEEKLIHQYLFIEEDRYTEMRIIEQCLDENKSIINNPLYIRDYCRFYPPMQEVWVDGKKYNTRETARNFYAYLRKVGFTPTTR